MKDHIKENAESHLNNVIEQLEELDFYRKKKVCIVYIIVDYFNVSCYILYKVVLFEFNHK